MPWVYQGHSQGAQGSEGRGVGGYGVAELVPGEVSARARHGVQQNTSTGAVRAHTLQQACHMFVCTRTGRFQDPRMMQRASVHAHTDRQRRAQRDQGEEGTPSLAPTACTWEGALQECTRVG